MKIKSEQFSVTNREEFKMKMLNWSARFNIFCFLDNNNYTFNEPAFDYMMGAGAHVALRAGDHSFSAIRDFSLNNPGFLFGHFNYPSSTKVQECERVGFPEAFFFQPQILLRMGKQFLTIDSYGEDPSVIFLEINGQDPAINPTSISSPKVEYSYSREEYLDAIIKIKQHIQRGDCYELNFCQDFFVRNVDADPMALFNGLNKLSPNPFAAFYRIEDKFCMCASPERFIRREGDTVISQPIKGTGKRDLADGVNDEAARKQLLESAKEQSENVMIVDLVRNDLSRVCKEGSVRVPELFGIYSFPQVHQMISTIAGDVPPGTHWTEIVDACFPMGSMTGAPKLRVMQLITEFEKTPRELFSGCIGYIDPAGNFDFNVVIRSLFFNSTKKFLRFYAGGGITFYSDPEKEYEETMVKASAIIELLK